MSTSHPEGTLDRGRAARYRNVLKIGRRDEDARSNQCESSTAQIPGSACKTIHTAGWFALLSFFATPHGLWCLYVAARCCSAFADEALLLSHPWAMFGLTSAITAVGSIATFVPFAKMLDRKYARNPGLRCQPSKTHSTAGFLSRLEVRLTLTNLVIAAVLTSAIGVLHVSQEATGIPWDKIYFGSPRTVSDWGYLVTSAVGFFLWIDLWAYLAHRCLHLPWLYKTVHKVHHTFKQPTAFSAMGLHPFDMLLLQGGIYVGLFVLPLHIAAITANLLYIHYHNLLDHSGIYYESWLPWQPSSLYHDDHHRLFHANYGQSLTLWDRLGGTLVSSKKTYSEQTFSY